MVWVYRITRRAGGSLLSRWDGEDNRWEPQCLFGLRPQRLENFVRRCRYKEASPNSHFRNGRVCTQLTRNGRVTLTDRKLIMTRGRRRIEWAVKSREEFDRLLRVRFGIILESRIFYPEILG